MEPIYRIVCYDRQRFSLTIRGGNVVFALTNHFDRYQLWIKDERHGATKDSEGQPAFAVINNATGQSICHCPIGQPLQLVRYNVNSCDKSVLWTMSGLELLKGFSTIRRADNISVCIRGNDIHDGKLVDIHLPRNDIKNVTPRSHCWGFKFENTSPSSCITLFRPSQHTVKITCKAKKGYNLAIDKDGRTVLLVPSNPKDKYQHWIKEMACGVPVKDEYEKEAFALVNKATGKAIKHGFGHNYLVQVALFNRNYMDPSLLWTEKYEPEVHYQKYVPEAHYRNMDTVKLLDDDPKYAQIRTQHNRDLVFNILDDPHKYPLLALSKRITTRHYTWEDPYIYTVPPYYDTSFRRHRAIIERIVANQKWMIEDYE